MGVWKRPVFGILTGYVFLLFVETIIVRQPFIGTHFRPKLFWSWSEWNVQKQQILTNVVMFIPVGIMAVQLWKWKGIFASIGLSCIIEALQFLTSRGLCEFDDILHNVIGSIIGIGVMMMVRKIIKAVGEKENDGTS